MVVKIGIVGTRQRHTIEDLLKVKVGLNKLRSTLPDYNDIHIISGGCPTGADSFAEAITKIEQFPITIFPAEWNKYGNSAGAIRNKQIAEESDYLIACVSKDRTGGTEITINEFIKHKGKDNLIIV